MVPYQNTKNINELQHAGNRVQHKLCAANTDCSVTMPGQNSVLLRKLTLQEECGIIAETAYYDWCYNDRIH